MRTQEIELERSLILVSSEKFKQGICKAQANKSFGSTKSANTVITTILEDFVKIIELYLLDYSKGRATRSTLAAQSISRLKNIQTTAFVVARVIFNSFYQNRSSQSLYREIGEALESEWKMEQYKEENLAYYKRTVNDLRTRGAKANRIKTVINFVFSKKLDFHLDSWSITEKMQAGMVLVRLFIESTGLIEFNDYYNKGKHYKSIVPTKEALKLIENLNHRFEVMHPQFMPMVCPPKDWSGIFEGGYISPYLRKNKLIKNNSKSYLEKLQNHSMPLVYSAINHIQATEWQINQKVFDVATAIWEAGDSVAEIPNREDKMLPPYPFPDIADKEMLTEEQVKTVKAWKAETYAIHKENIKKRSLRIAAAQILKIAMQYKNYEKIWFPYQMDFRGRLYPIPVLLQPQGSDLAKGLLRFAEGKALKDNSTAIKWLEIHGANMFGIDKVSYEDRIKWVHNNKEEIKLFALNPLENRGWEKADKPFQFLAWCFEYTEFLTNPETFETHIPIQLDGTCNGLQHYSALLKDEVGGKAVNLVDTNIPSDIYAIVAEKLITKLKEIENDKLAKKWLGIEITRKLTKRPVMVLPYGATRYACREYIEEYLKENFSLDYLWKYFNIGKSPQDCIFKASYWLSFKLWDAITETVESAIVGMDYLREIASKVSTQGDYLEWTTPAGLLVRQKYQAQAKKMIRTELYGSIIKSTVNLDIDKLDKKRQSNGICPNFIHSLDAACLMLYLNKCKEAGINSFMAVHDCYGVHATDTELSAKLLREAFVEVYSKPILKTWVDDVTNAVEINSDELPKLPEEKGLNIEDVLKSKYFFN